MTFRCHTVSSLTYFVYCELEQHAYFRARISIMPAVCRFLPVYYYDQKQFCVVQELILGSSINGKTELQV